MAITVTERYRKISSSGNSLEIGYKLAFSATYAAGGYTINNAALPGANQDFSKIYDVKHSFGQLNPENGNLLWIDYANLDNDDSTDPEFKVELYDESTGGNYEVVATGAAITGDFYIAVTGVPVGSVDGGNI